jgi:ubiquinone/menaquinone biosynthesis C-methylase UbiE
METLDNDTSVNEKALKRFEYRATQTKWGSYITEAERRAILKAHAVSRRPSKAVDIGCGGGRWSKLVAAAGWEMTCVEVDSKVLSLCQRRLPNARCVLVDSSNSTIPCDTESVELVLCMEIPQVMQSDWFVDEAHRVLRPGGMIVGVFLNVLSYRGFIAHLTAPLRGVYDYYRSAYVPFRNQLRKHGFCLMHEEGLCWFPFRRFSNSALVPAFTVAERYLGLSKLVSLSPWVVFVAQKRS